MARGGSTGRRRGDPRGRRGGRATRAPSHPDRSRHPAPPGWLAALPEELLAQSLLPWLVWHDTSALGCVAQALSRVVRHARHGHAQWASHTFTGDSLRGCLRAMATQLGRGATGAPRFAPNLAMASVAFAHAHDTREAQSAWSELVDTVVASDVLPVGCVLVGALSQRHGATDRGVALTLSLGHLARTVVDTAAFDRKALRWSASGLTEELECPFRPDDDESEEVRQDERPKTSLLVWSTSAKPAQVLLSLASQWFPDAAVAGGVLARADHAPSLMTFRRAGNAPRRAKVVSQRKMKAATRAPMGVVAFPSTLLVRLRGKAFIQPLDLCLDRPLTPILRNEALSDLEDVELMRQDIRAYSTVSLLDKRIGGEENTHRLGEIIGHFMEGDRAPEGILKLYASASPDALRRAILPGQVEARVVSSTPASTGAESIRSILLYVDRRGMLTLRDHWEVGEYGVVTARLPPDELSGVIEELVDAQLLRVHRASTRPLGSVVFCSTEIDLGSSTHILDSIRSSLTGVSSHELVVNGEIGPIRMPMAEQSSPFQLQTGTVHGFMLCYSS